MMLQFNPYRKLRRSASNDGNDEDSRRRHRHRHRHRHQQQHSLTPQQNTRRRLHSRQHRDPTQSQTPHRDVPTSGGGGGGGGLSRRALTFDNLATAPSSSLPVNIGGNAHPHPHHCHRRQHQPYNRDRMMLPKISSLSLSHRDYALNDPRLSSGDEDYDDDDGGDGDGLSDDVVSFGSPSTASDASFRAPHSPLWTPDGTMTASRQQQPPSHQHNGSPVPTTTHDDVEVTVTMCVEMPPSDVLCSICGHVCNEAVRSEVCDHAFCHEHILMWLAEPGQRCCPVDQHPLVAAQVHEDTALRKRIGAIQVHCGVGKCSAVVSVGALHTHRASECIERRIRCQLCHKRLRAIQLHGHMRSDADKHVELLRRENERLRDEVSEARKSGSVHDSNEDELKQRSASNDRLLSLVSGLESELREERETVKRLEGLLRSVNQLYVDQVAESAKLRHRIGNQAELQVRARAEAEAQVYANDEARHRILDQVPGIYSRSVNDAPPHVVVSPVRHSRTSAITAGSVSSADAFTYLYSPPRHHHPRRRRRQRRPSATSSDNGSVVEGEVGGGGFSLEPTNGVSTSSATTGGTFVISASVPATTTTTMPLVQPCDTEPTRGRSKKQKLKKKKKGTGDDDVGDGGGDRSRSQSRHRSSSAARGMRRSRSSPKKTSRTKARATKTIPSAAAAAASPAPAPAPAAPVAAAKAGGEFTWSRREKHSLVAVSSTDGYTATNRVGLAAKTVTGDVVWSAGRHTFGVSLRQCPGGAVVGLVPANVKQSWNRGGRVGVDVHGWAVETTSGRRYSYISADGKRENEPFCTPIDGSSVGVLGVLVDLDRRMVEYFIDNTSLGVAFVNVVGPVKPSCSLLSQHDTVVLTPYHLPVR